MAAASVWAGYLGTIHGFAMALAAPLWGALADRLGRRPMVVRSMVGGGITVLLMAYVVSVEQLLVVRFLHGVLSGSVTASITLVSTTTPKQHLAFALGMLQTAFMFGGAIGTLVGGPAIDYFGYYNCFLGSGLLVTVAGVMVQWQVKENFQRVASQ
ncbi:MAG: MFS transporter, partial [Gemmatimonadetes bacterium]|nr:MFS transporter [Gemmatimonadota bacterium]